MSSSARVVFDPVRFSSDISTILQTVTTINEKLDSSETLKTIRERGLLKVGTSGGAAGFSKLEPGYTDGTGFDVDFGKAICAAIFGNTTSITYKEVTTAERFSKLLAKDYDVLLRNTTWTLGRETVENVEFGPTTFYDGQQILGRKVVGFTENSTLQDLNGKKIGTNPGSTSLVNLEAFKEKYNLDYEIVEFVSISAAIDALLMGNLDAVSTDGSALAGNRADQGQENNWVIFPKKPLSKEPLGPAYNKGDNKWATIVNWVVYSTILAEEYEITSANIDTKLPNMTSDIKRIFGAEDTAIQDALDLDKNAFYNVIKLVGNYGEIFNRNLTSLGITRQGSLNALYTNGGLLYAPPVGFEGLF